jgi:hypothetical protein
MKRPLFHSSFFILLSSFFILHPSSMPLGSAACCHCERVPAGRIGIGTEVGVS